MNGQVNQSHPAPHLPQLNANGELNAADIHHSVQVLIPLYHNIKAGDKVSVCWEGTPTEPEVSFPRIHTIDQTDTMLAVTIPGYSGWQKLKVWYHVQGVGLSEAREVKVAQ
ncbi:hypothetical protein K5D34_00190 [Pseudomonas cichorii]|nr:hypothetical protein [Pseudomonas cichorii]MBX8508109.1 hypothetical protein [Pseudomonas cichorii]MBX8526276.1 hypothetical protein [Pseudomonas cichorii]